MEPLYSQPFNYVFSSILRVIQHPISGADVCQNTNTGMDPFFGLECCLKHEYKSGKAILGLAPAESIRRVTSNVILKFSANE